VKFGIFTVVTVVLTGLLITVIGSISFVPTRHYSAIFSDATQVQPGDEVRLAGVKVGSVTSLHLYDRNQAEVEFKVDKSVHVYQGARIAIQYQNLIGQRFLAIDEQPGGIAQPANEPITKTTPALNLTDLFNGFKPLFQALDPQQVNQLSMEIIATLQGEGGNLQQLLANTAQLTTTIADKDAVVGQVVDNLDALLSTVDARDTKLTALIGNFRDLMVGLAKNRSTIDTSLPDLSRLLTATTGLLSQVRSPLHADIGHLNQLATKVNSTKSQLNQVLHALPHKLTVITRTASYGAWFNFYLCGADVRLTLFGHTIQLNTPVSVQANERDTVCGLGPNNLGPKR
jgi:phospholipid/cholesterol/gamma-HCH transport system substrate-binding protein